jgi:hypothetical protein
MQVWEAQELELRELLEAFRSDAIDEACQRYLVHVFDRMVAHAAPSL